MAVRVSIPSKYVSLADEILASTTVGDYSSLIGILLARYGNHLKQTWDIAVPPQVPAVQQPYSAAPAAPEPFTEVEF